MREALLHFYEDSPAMGTSRPYIGCKISLISEAQHRYEGILYTIDKKNSTIALAKVKCFGTELRPTSRPTPPRDDLFEFITFRGSDIKDITLCESPRYDLPQDAAIQPLSHRSASGVDPGHQSLDSELSAFNQLTSSLIGQDYAAALGLGLHARRGPMVEKAVQTLHMGRNQQRRFIAGLQEQRIGRRRNQRSFQTRGDGGSTASVRSGSAEVTLRGVRQQDSGIRPPIRRKGPRRRRNGAGGQLRVANVPAPTLKFDTDFDFDSSNAKFIKEEIEREMDRMMIKDGNYEDEKENEGLHLSEDDPFGPRCYYDKSKSFFDNISSDSGSRGYKLTWAEERKLNLETFGVPGRYRRGQTFRGTAGRRGGGGALPAYPTRTVQ